MELKNITAAKLRKMLDSKEIGAKEAASEFLSEIKKNDDKVLSFITVTEDEAMKNAEAAQKRIDTGDADHDYRRLLGKSVYHLAHSFRYASEVSAGDKIRLIHSQIEETVFVSLHGTDRGCIPPAAAGRYDQHHGSGNRKACSLDAKTFRAGGIKGQSRG